MLDAGHGFESLSVKDLLEARDLYHNHLLGKPNVVGTAVGLYLIRDAEHEARGKAHREGQGGGIARSLLGTDRTAGAALLRALDAAAPVRGEARRLLAQMPP